MGQRMLRVNPNLGLARRQRTNFGWPENNIFLAPRARGLAIPE
jgi:hypothetical protein